jgi:hypothetical protein
MCHIVNQSSQKPRTEARDVKDEPQYTEVNWY